MKEFSIRRTVKSEHREYFPVNVFILLVIAALLTTSCSHTKKDAARQAKATATDSIKMLSAGEVNQVAGIGLVEPMGQIAVLSAQLPGVVTSILKNEGDTVKAGNIILRMEDRDEQLALQKLQAQKNIQQANITSAQAKIDDTSARLTNKQTTLTDSRQLQGNGAETRQNVDNLNTDVTSLTAQLQQNQSDLASAKAQLKVLNTETEQARLNIEKKTIRAPQDGVILKILAIKNEYASQFSNMVNFAPAGPVMVRCEIDEMFAGCVSKGQAVDIRNIGFNKVIATGKVVLLAPSLSQKSMLSENPSDQQDRRVREIRIQLDNPDGLLYNSRVECTIKLKP